MRFCRSSIVLVSLLLSAAPLYAWTVDGNEYTTRKKITVQTANVDADLSNFPLYVNIDNDADIADSNDDGFDIRFTTSDGTTEIPYERESWTGGGGANVTANFWVKSNIADGTGESATEIYIYYRTADTADGEDAENVWDANYKGVWHLEETVANEETVASAHKDSTSNGNDGDQKGNDDAAGVISNGQEFDGSNDYIDCDDVGDWTDDFTLEAWASNDTNGTFVSRRDAGTTQYQMGLSDDKTFFSSNSVVRGSNPSNAWHYYATVVDGAATQMYLDGATDGAAFSPTVTSQVVDFWIGARGDGVPSTGFEYGGIIDEVRISNIPRSAAWIKFVYENINQGDNELTYGDEDIQKRYWVNDDGDNSWNNADNWALTSGGAGGAGVPTSTIDVYFDGNGTDACTVDVGVTIASLSVSAAYAAGGNDLDMDGEDITVTGNVDIASGGYTKGGGTFTLGDNSGDGTQTIDFNDNTMEDLVVNAAGDTKQLTGGGTFDSLTVSAGTMDANDNSITVTGNIDMTGGSYTKGTGTFTLSGSTANGTQTIDFNDLSIEDLVINDAGDTKQLTDGVVTESVTITNGTLDANSNSITVGGSWANTGTFLSGTGVVIFNGAGAATLVPGAFDADHDFHDLTFSGAGSLALTGNLLVNNDLTLSNGAFNNSAGFIWVSGDVDFTGTTYTKGAVGIYLGGSTANGTQTIDFNDANIETFYVNDDGDTKQLTDGVTVASIQLMAGSLDFNSQAVDGGSTALSIADGAFLVLDGDETITNLTMDTDTGTVVFDDTASRTLLSTFTTYNNVTIDESGAGDPTFTLPDANIIINGVLTLTDGNLTFDNDKNLTINDTDNTGTALSIAGGQTLSNTGAGDLAIDAAVSNTGTITFTGTGDLVLGGDVSNAGTISFNGNGGGGAGGDADDISITSSVGGTRRNWQGAGTFTMVDVTVEDQSCIGATPASIVPVSSTNAGNNIYWLFGGETNTVSGRVYDALGGAAVGSGVVVTVGLYDESADTTSYFTGITDGSGDYLVWVTELAAGDVVVVYLDGLVSGKEGTAVTKINGAGNIAGLDLYYDAVSIEEEGGGIENVDLANLDSNKDDDIKFTVAAGDLTIASAFTLYINSGDTFTPGGDISLGGSWSNAGTFVSGTDKVTFTGGGAETCVTGGTGAGQDFYDLTFSGAGSLTLTTNNLLVNHDFTLSAGTFDANDRDITVIEDINFTGTTYTKGTGTFTLSGSTAAGTQTIDFNDLSIEDLVINDADDTKQLTDGVTVESLTVTAGTLETSSFPLTINGSIIINGGTMVCGTGVVAFGNGGVDTVDITSGELELGGDDDGDFVINLGAGNWTNTAGLINITGELSDANFTFISTSDTGYYNLTVNSAGSFTATDELVVQNDLTITQGTIVPATARTADLDINGNLLINGGTLSADTANCGVDVEGNVTVSTGTLSAPDAYTGFKVGGDWVVADAATFDPGTGHVTFDSGDAANITMDPANNTFYGLRINGTGPITLQNALLLQDSLVVAAGELDLGADHALTVTDGVILVGTIDAQGSTITVGGDWDSTAGTFTYDTSTLELTKADADFDIVYGQDFYNLVFDTAGQTITISSRINIYGTLTVGSAAGAKVTVESGGIIDLYNGTTPIVFNRAHNVGYDLGSEIFIVQPSGDVDLAGGTYGSRLAIRSTVDATVTMLGDIAGGDLWVYGHGGGDETILDTTGNNYSITMSDEIIVGESGDTDCYGKIICHDSVITVADDVIIQPSDGGGTNEIDADTSAWVVSGAWANSDTFTADTSSVTLNGGGAETLVTGGTGAGQDFYDLTYSGAGSLTLTTNNLLVSHDLTVSGGTFDANDLDITVSEDIDFTGLTTYTKGTGTLTLSGSTAAGIQTIDFDDKSIEDLLVNDAGDTKQLTDGVTAESITISAGSLDCNSQAVDGGSTALSIADGAFLVLDGDETITNLTMDTDTGTVVFDDTASRTLLSTFTTYNNVTIDESGAGDPTFTLPDVNITVNGVLTITDGNLTYDNDKNLEINDTDATGTALSVANGQILANTGTGDLTIAAAVSNAGTITFNGNGGAGAGGDNDDISIVSSDGATKRNWQGAGTFTIVDATVSYQTCVGGTPGSIAVLSGTDSGNNVNWAFGTNTVSGRVYDGLGGAAVGAGVVVTVAVYDTGSSAVTYYNDTTDGSGDYSITNGTFAAGDVVVAYLDDLANEGTAATRPNGAGNVTGLDLYYNAVDIRDEGGGISNADLAKLDSGKDDDIKFTVAVGDLTISGVFDLYINSGDTFTPVEISPSEAAGLMPVHLYRGQIK